jgi:hypothetical protein
MKRLLTLALALVVSLASADTTNNVISGVPWTGVTTGTLPANRMPGSALLYDTATGTVNWSYNTATAAKTIAINNALSGSGVQVGGYNYTYDLRNMNGDNRQGSTDTMTVTTRMTSNTGATLLSNTNTHNTRFDWTTFTGSQSLSTAAPLSGLGNLSISFTSRDTGFWAGYFGPEVRNVGMSLNYTFDQCSADPLSSPSCPGYQQAYTDQQCAANPLYATSCAGYAAAYTTQQCSSNPLYSTACPGYQQAYHDQQCAANPLYATDCVGYQAAYHTQQCAANPLYMSDCTGYADALFAQTCTNNPLSSTRCSGYQAAYMAQQCTANALYDRSCPNYGAAYAAKNVLTAPAPVVVSTVAPTETTQQTSSTTVAISDPVVKSAVTTSSTTSPTSPTSVVGPISVINPPKAAGTDSVIASISIDPPVSEAKQQEQKQEQKKTEGQVARALAKSGAGAAKEAAEKSANAKSLEDQAATQGLVVGLMGHVPGFNAYQNAMVPDVNAAAMARQYFKPNVDNRNSQRRLNGASDAKWQEMVDSQYQIGN